jgi:hypothetical protein
VQVSSRLVLETYETNLFLEPAGDEPVTTRTAPIENRAELNQSTSRGLGRRKGRGLAKKGPFKSVGRGRGGLTTVMTELLKVRHLFATWKNKANIELSGLGRSSSQHSTCNR